MHAVVRSDQLGSISLIMLISPRPTRSLPSAPSPCFVPQIINAATGTCLGVNSSLTFSAFAPAGRCCSCCRRRRRCRCRARGSPLTLRRETTPVCCPGPNPLAPDSGTRFCTLHRRRRSLSHAGEPLHQPDHLEPCHQPPAPLLFVSPLLPRPSCCEAALLASQRVGSRAHRCRHRPLCSSPRQRLPTHCPAQHLTCVL